MFYETFVASVHFYTEDGKGVQNASQQLYDQIAEFLKNHPTLIEKERSAPSITTTPSHNGHWATLIISVTSKFDYN